MRDLAFDDLAFAQGRLHAAQAQQFQRRADRRQWVVQFVAEHGEELVLRAVGCLGGLRSRLISSRQHLDR